MSETKALRTKKRQFGQFLTPKNLSTKIVKTINFSSEDKILEPSFGDGSFIFSIIEKLIQVYPSNLNIKNKLDNIFENNIFGVELDKILYNKFFDDLKKKYNYIPLKHNLFNKDFFRYNCKCKFDFIIGNPPFGGTINKKYQDELDKNLGQRYGMKIKKETYSFFIVKSVDLLKKNGRMIFICGDSFLTINTMKGLRNFLMKEGYVKIKELKYFSEETNYGMLVVGFYKEKKVNYVNVNNNKILYDTISLTPNLSWKINDKYIDYFRDKKIGDYLVCSSGMTIGKNEYFIRKIKQDNTIDELYKFYFFEDPITLKKEISKARFNKISDTKKTKIIDLEAKGATKTNIRISKTEVIKNIKIPNKNYKYYNKASRQLFYEKPKYVIYWKDNGRAVYTYKKNGNWYLHGIGGKPFFEKEGLTWALIAKQIYVRYLPSGYILDSGAPIGILKENIEKDELFFIIGWLSTNICNSILKEVINHTKNIQSKDVERLPYPFWVNKNNKQLIIEKIKNIIEDINKNNKKVSNEDMEFVEKLFEKNWINKKLQK